MRKQHIYRAAVVTAVVMLLALFGISNTAFARESKRGIDLSDSVVSGLAGGTETRSWVYLDSASVWHYAYAAQDGNYVAPGSVALGQTASVISDFGTTDLSGDDALGGPLNNGTCYPSWKSGERCGRPLYKNYPLTWG